MAPLAAWSAGLLLQLRQASLWPSTDYLLLGALGLLLMGLGTALRRTTRLGGAGTVALLAGLLVLGLACAGGRALSRQAGLLDPALDNQVLWLEGTVDTLPQSGPEGAWLLVEVARGGRTPEPSVSSDLRLPERVRLFWPLAPRELAAGERWRWQARLRLPHGLSNPHGFDRELWLWEQGVGATGVVRTGPQAPAPQRLESPGWRPVERLRGQLAAAVRERVTDPRVAGVVAALLVGEQSAIERADWRVFRDTGVAHLVSISGLHITLFGWLARALVAWLWRAAARPWPGWLLRWPVPHAAGWGGLALATAYALLAGWGVPAQRTVFMLGLLTCLRWRGIDWPWPLQWLMVLAAVLTLDPWAGLQAGFWLSFVAVMLLFVSEPGAREGADGLSRTERWWVAARRLLREQWVMTVALAPLTLLLFGQVSVAGLLANLLAIPWVTLVVTPLALTGVLLPPLWVACGWAVQALLALLQPMAAWAHAVWHLPAAPPELAWAAVIGGFLLGGRWPVVWRLAGVGLMLPALLYQPPRPAWGEFELLAPDVGQGSAVLVRTARRDLMFDAGPRYRGGGDTGAAVLAPLLRRLGVSLDALVVSHEDSDHSGGAESLLASFGRARYLSSHGPGPGPLSLAREGLADGGSARCEAGQAWTWEGVSFTVLHPGPDDRARWREGNALSCVLLVDNGRRRALLTGDIGIDQEVALAARHPTLAVDLLVSAHHGSRTSSSPVWLNQLMPRWVIVQAGHHNRFGHPAAEVLARYEARGADWVASPSCGLAAWRSSQPGRPDCWRQLHRRYWQHGRRLQAPPSPDENMPEDPP